MYKNRIRELYAGRLASRSTIISGFTLILAIFFIAIGCDSIVDQKIDADDSISTSAMAGTFSMVQASTIECIDPTVLEYNKVTDLKSTEWGNPRDLSSKTVDLEYYNTLSQFVLRVKSTGIIADVLVDDKSIKDFDGRVAADTWQEFTFELEEDWQAGDTWAFEIKVNGSGTRAEFDVDYVLVDECDDVDSGRDTETEVVDVLNLITNRTWMDRNLGASQAATSSRDAQAYGDYFTFDEAVTVCPVGYRLPTETEWQSEIDSWSPKDATGAFNSIKLPLAGYFDVGSNSLYDAGSVGYYWSSSKDLNHDDAARFLYFNPSPYMNTNYIYQRLSVRCLKEDTSD